jgi:hypothetical protein
MPGDNGVVVAANSTPAPTLNDVAAPKADLVRQFATTTDGGLIAQLTSNPFFTAVRLRLLT